MDRPGTCIIILDENYNIGNSSCHFGSYCSIWTGPSPKNIIWTSEYGSIWTGPSPKKYHMDLRRFGPYNIFLVTDRSIYCHMTLSAMNYLLYSLIFLIHNIDYLSILHYAWRHTYREYSVPVSLLVMTISQENIQYQSICW